MTNEERREALKGLAPEERKAKVKRAHERLKEKGVKTRIGRKGFELGYGYNYRNPEYASRAFAAVCSHYGLVKTDGITWHA